MFLYRIGYLHNGEFFSQVQFVKTQRNPKSNTKLNPSPNFNSNPKTNLKPNLQNTVEKKLFKT